MHGRPPPRPASVRARSIELAGSRRGLPPILLWSLLFSFRFLRLVQLLVQQYSGGHQQGREKPLACEERVRSDAHDDLDGDQPDDDPLQPGGVAICHLHRIKVISNLQLYKVLMQ
jgi:hypothetical protein